MLASQPILSLLNEIRANQSNRISIFLQANGRFVVPEPAREATGNPSPSFSQTSQWEKYPQHLKFLGEVSPVTGYR